MAISDAQFAVWLQQDNADRCVHAELDYQYESGSPPVPATGTFYYSDKVYFDGTGANPYVDAIASVPKFSRSLGGNQFGTYSSSLGSLELNNADGSQDSLLTLAIDGSAIRLKLGDVSWPPSDFRLIFSALSLRATAPSIDRISVQLKDTGLLLNQSIGGTIKIGGTGPNADQWRPVNFGLVHQVECKVLNQTTLTYVHSDTGYGLATSSGSYAMTVRDRGVPVVFTNNGDGTITLAASPAGTITADVLYVSPGPGSEWRSVSDAMKFFIGDRVGLSALGLYYGPGPTFNLRPDPAVGAWLATGGEDYQVGISIGDKRNVQDLLGDLTDSGLCFWAIRRDSKFTFGRLRPNYIAGFSITPTKILTDDLIDDGSITLEHLVPGYYQLQATMSKNWSIQTDLASSLSVAEHAKFTRSGLYVLQDNGVGTDYANAPQSYNKTLTQSPQIETLLSGADDTTDPVLLKLWMEVRRAMSLPWLSLVTMTTGVECYDLELGDPVTVKIPRFGYDAGVDFQVIGIDINLPSKVALKLLRRDPQQTTGRTTTPPTGAPFSGAAALFIATASFIAGEATGTGTGTAAAAPSADMTATASFIPGTASAINASPPGGGTGGSSVTSITATAPVVVTPSPIVSTGVVSITDFVASGGSHARGAVPDPGASAGTTKFLREDATWTSPGIASPLTTKGDVYGYSTVDARVPVGTNSHVLTADSAQTLGIKWAAIPTSGSLQSQEFTSSGTFNVPTGVSGVWVTMTGGGGGGSATIVITTGGGGGGSAEMVQNLAVPVTSGGTVTVTIGAKGTGGATGQSSAQVGVAGGDTSFGSVFKAKGGLGGATNGASGAGGGVGGNGAKSVANPGTSGGLGTIEAVTYFGGASGGAGGSSSAANGGASGPAGGYPTGAAGGTGGSQAGGGGGANTIYGLGGAGGNGNAVGTNAASASYGAGGGGAGGHLTTTVAGGDGCAGYCLVVWVA